MVHYYHWYIIVMVYHESMMYYYYGILLFFPAASCKLQGLRVFLSGIILLPGLGASVEAWVFVICSNNNK